jgi:hypothetical protein
VMAVAPWDPRSCASGAVPASPQLNQT